VVEKGNEDEKDSPPTLDTIEVARMLQASGIKDVSTEKGPFNRWLKTKTMKS